MKLLFHIACVLFLSASMRAQLPLLTASPESYLYTGPVSTANPPAHMQPLQSGSVRVSIKLQDPPLISLLGENAKQNGIAMSEDAQRAYLAQLKQKQDAVMAQAAALGGVELGRVSKGHNAVFVSIDSRQITSLKNIGGVSAVRTVSDYTFSLANTLPYVGATAVQSSGSTGQGIRIAMLDSGIDYTHYNLGGSGNVADYQIAKAAAAGVPPRNLFPTAKVIGGTDFVGDVWPNGPGGLDGPLAPDPNPIDLNGHGTHTADIAGGRSNDGAHVGAAPGSQLYAIKICSSVASSCSSIAILEGIDYALDPDNTGTLNHAVDIISMSVGGAFGQREDDASEMFTSVVHFGVVSVLAGGNRGNIPYVVDAPGATPEVIAVAATTGVTSSFIPLVINSPASIQGTYGNVATLDFAPINTPVTGNVVYVGRGCPASGSTPADPYPSGNLSGMVFLIDRGSCNVSLKIDRAARAGATGVLIGLVAPGDAIPFSNAGGTNFVPSLVITQAYSTLIKNALPQSAVNVTLSASNAILTAGNIASYSSRGPNFSYNMLKPDMSAPGTIVAADPGTGNGQSSEDGTSFACPLTAGSAALLLSKNPRLTPLDIKALLMETAEPNVYANSALSPGALTPMSRMGSGELRVDRAAAATTAAWDASNPLSVSLSFGTYRLNAPQTFKKKVVVRNYSDTSRSYQIGNVYRNAPNVTGVTLNMPSSIFVPANGSANFTLTATVTPSALPTWTLDGGVNGGNGSLLDTVEYAGYLTFTSGTENVHLPWHILPHKAANVQPSFSSVSLNGDVATLPLTNLQASVAGLVDVFSLTGTGTQFPASSLPPPGSEYTLTNLKAVGVRLNCANNACSSYAAQFAITTFGQRSHPDVPAEFDIYVDVNNDGEDDFVIFNGDIGDLTTGTFSGQNGIFVVDIAADTTVAGPYYTTADLDSANVIFTVPLSALTTSTGLKVTESTPFTFSVYAFDSYFTGHLTDQITSMRYELDMPAYYSGLAQTTVPANGLSQLPIYPNNASYPFLTGSYNGNSPSQKGLLLMYRDGKDGQETSVVTVAP